MMKLSKSTQLLFLLSSTLILCASAEEFAYNLKGRDWDSGECRVSEQVILLFPTFAL
jgi:hypothetical protein